jgi:very-short-patch-repair endonuclease
MALWEHLRARRLAGWKFRRQHPLGRYIADFYCAEGALVVELDGRGHRREDQREYDQIRDTELGARGLSVLRIQNGEIVADLAHVLQRIEEALPLSTRGEGVGG